MKRFLLALLILTSILVNSGCQTTSQGIGSSSVSTNREQGAEGILAYDLDYAKALEIAVKVCNNTFDVVQLIDDGTTIKVYHEGNFWTQGTAGARITPQLVRSNKDPETNGIIFKINAYGEGYNASMLPSFMTSMFFKELDSVAHKNELKKIMINDFYVSEDKGDTPSLLGTLPTEINEFKEYLNSKKQLHKHEGIWKSSDGRYLLGIVYDQQDILYRYKAFIIESDATGWLPGDVKCRWTSLDESSVSMGDWYMSNKLKKSSVFKVENNLIFPVANSELSDIALVKIYPGTAGSNSQSTGTGFTISPNGLIVTAYHVIEGSDSIEALVPGLGFRPAKIIASNPSNDIAIIKVQTETKNYLNISDFKSSKVSDKIYTLGYPLSSVLGDEPKYSEGVVNSLTGLGDSASLMQVSIPIQPGNSGGPVLNNQNEVVGMIVSTAGIEAFYALSGTIPQNVNWAVKSDYIRLITDIESIEKTENNKLDDVMRAVCFIRVK